MGPGAGFGILVHAAPDRIDQRDGGIQRLPGALDRGGVAGLGAGDRQIHAVGVDEFLVLAPAAEFFLVGFVDILRQRGAPFLVEEGGGRRLDLEGFADRRSGRGIVDDGLEQRLHPLRLDISPDLGDLGAVGAEHDGRRPAPVAIAARQIGVGVLVDPDRQIFRGQQFPDLGIGVGRLLHDVAPVAPHRLEIEDDEALLGLRAGEQIVAPFTPFRSVRRKRGRRRKRGEGEGGDADEFHGGSRKRWRFDSYAARKIRAQLFARCHRIVRLRSISRCVPGRIHQQPVQ